MVTVIQTKADFYTITYDFLRNAKDNNIMYVELMFDPSTEFMELNNLHRTTYTPTISLIPRLSRIKSGDLGLPTCRVVVFFGGAGASWGA